MKLCAARLRAGEPADPVMAAGAELIENAGFALAYFEVRHAETLAPIASRKDGPMRMLVAAKIGNTRLIDNIAV
jgi:pantoate--beta-alanine ligase